MPPGTERDIAAARPASGLLVGRDRELARMRAVLQEVLDGSGRLVLLSGEPGAGKTRLAEEMAREARERSAKVAWGRSWEGEGAPDLWPWLQVIRAFLRELDEDALRERVGPHGGALTALVAPLGHPGEGVDQAPESPSARFRLFNAIAHFLDAHAERGPLVLILEDLHRADPASLLLLQFFTQEQRQRRIFTIATYREPGAAPNRGLTQAVIEALREPGTERLMLGGLSPAQSAALLAASFETDPDAALARELHEWTGGNPLFLVECARAMRTRGDLGVPRSTISSVDLPVPDELREVIDQRLAPLSVAEREALRRAAALGREFRKELLACPADASPPPAEQPERDVVHAAVALAEKLGLVLRGADGEYRFAHGMIRAVLANEAPAEQRAEIGRVEAQRIESPPPQAADPAAASLFVFRKEGEYWTLSFAGQTRRIKDVKGLAYVALLLQHPRKPMHVTEIAMLGTVAADAADVPSESSGEAIGVRADLGDSGIVLDEQARAEYRRRLDDLRAELEQAESFHDAGRVDRLQEEIDFLTQELAAAVGLGGRARRAGSHTERARVNVTRSISRALDRMAEVHPELADHLGRTIKTGTFCTYEPDRSFTAAWEI